MYNAASGYSRRKLPAGKTSSDSTVKRRESSKNAPASSASAPRNNETSSIQSGGVTCHAEGSWTRPIVAPCDTDTTTSKNWYGQILRRTSSERATGSRFGYGKSSLPTLVTDGSGDPPGVKSRPDAIARSLMDSDAIWVGSDVSINRSVGSDAIAKRFVDSDAIAKRFVDSDAIAKRPVDSEAIAKRTVDSNAIPKRSVDSKVNAKRYVDSKVKTKRSVDSKAKTKRSVDSKAKTKRSVDSNVCTKRSVDSKVSTKPSVDSIVSTKRSVNSKAKTKRFLDFEARSDCDFIPKRVVSPEVIADCTLDSEGNANFSVDFDAIANPLMDSDAIANCSVDSGVNAFRSDDFDAISSQKLDFDTITKRALDFDTIANRPVGSDGFVGGLLIGERRTELPPVDSQFASVDQVPKSCVEDNAHPKLNLVKTGTREGNAKRTRRPMPRSAAWRTLLRVRRQNKKRQAEFKARRRQRAAHRRNFIQDRINSLVRIGANRMKKKEYPINKVRMILQVGSARAPGSRASLSEVISLFSENTDRWSVSLQRWRTFYWMLQKQIELYRRFIEDDAVCLSVKGDSTEFRLCSQKGVVSTEEISVRCVSVYSKSGVLKLCPEFNRLQSKDYRGVVSTFNVDDLLLDRFTREKDELRILILSMDNHSANRLAIRHIIWKLRGFGNLLIGSVICFDHSLANSAKWGGITFPVGEVLRTTHFLKCRPIPNLSLFCHFQVSGDVVPFDSCNMGSTRLICNSRMVPSSLSLRFRVFRFLLS